MDFEREDSPPPAYSESEFDKKLSSGIQFLEISEETEEEWDESRSEGATSSGVQPASYPARNDRFHTQQSASTTTSHKTVRRLPVPPREGVANDSPLRIHKKSSSHTYAIPSVLSYSKPHPKWHEGVEEPTSPKIPSRSSRTNVPSYLSNRGRSPVISATSASVPTNSSQHHFSDPKNDYLFPQSPSSSPLTKSSPARSVSHTRAVSVSRLNFDASIAYGPSDFAPVSAGSTRSESTYHHHTFSPNSLYNSAVSSQLRVPSSVPSQLNNHHTPLSRSGSPQRSVNLSTVARPPQDTWTSPVLSPLQRPQSPSSLSHFTGATRFPLNPSHIPNSTQIAHDRWATSEHQFVHT